jgi:hypothetical protein
LADAILKLEDEVVKLIKVIGSSLLKDATQDDLAIISQQSNAGGSNDNNSEFARLQRLPGFSRMQRQLFFNMMTARPDVSDQNIRVKETKKAKKLSISGAAHHHHHHHHHQHKAKKGHVHSDASLPGSDNIEEKGVESFGATETVEEESAMARSTIKNISRLILERDGMKMKSANAAERRH